MNQIILIGRLTEDPELTDSAGSAYLLHSLL